MIPTNPPKFKVGDRIIPTSIDLDAYPKGYVIGLIALDNLGGNSWVYWGLHEYRHIPGLIITPGFAEPYIELYEETDHVG